MQISLGKCYYGDFDEAATATAVRDDGTGWIAICEEHRDKAEKDGYKPGEPMDNLEPVTGDDGGHERRDGDEYRVHPEDLRKQRARAHPPGTSAPLASGLMVEGPHGAAIISEALNPDRLSRTSV